MKYLKSTDIYVVW